MNMYATNNPPHHRHHQARLKSLSVDNLLLSTTTGPTKDGGNEKMMSDTINHSSAVMKNTDAHTTSKQKHGQNYAKIDTSSSNTSSIQNTNTTSVMLPAELYLSSYTCGSAIQGSDHKPVIAIFDAYIRYLYGFCDDSEGDEDDD